MRTYLISFIIYTSIFGNQRQESKCPYESDKEQAITCVCKGKINGGCIIKGPFCNYAQGGKESDYCGCKTKEDARKLCQEKCPRPTVEEVKVFEKKKPASK